MQRTPEPELMDDAEQARAYAEADFEEPHNQFVAQFRSLFPGEDAQGDVLDLGCGPADVLIRFARAFPRCHIDGIDGAAAMLAHGQAAVERAGFSPRVRLFHGYLPGAELPNKHYAAVISNSLLHHLNDPAVLWRAVRDHAAPGAAVFVMDLMRPASPAQAQDLVDQYATNEPEVLRRDFYNSLLAAYEVGEVTQQLLGAGLPQLRVEAVSDRHLVVWGRV